MSEKKVYFSLNETSSPGLVTNGDSHDHTSGHGATIPIGGGGTGQTTAQAAIDALTAVSGATIGHALVKDADGHATWAAVGGGMTTEVLTGSGNWTVPDGKYIVFATLSAAGGGGRNGVANAGGGGGGGGSASQILEIPIPVVPGQTIPYSVPAAAAYNTDGGDCSFGSLKCLGGKSVFSGGDGAIATYSALPGGVAGAKPAKDTTPDSSIAYQKWSIPGSGGGAGGAFGAAGSPGAASALYGATTASPTGTGGTSAAGRGGGGGGGADSLFGMGGAGANAGAEGAAGLNGSDGTGYGSGGGGGSGGDTGQTYGFGGNSGPGVIILRY